MKTSGLIALVAAVSLAVASPRYFATQCGEVHSHSRNWIDRNAPQDVTVIKLDNGEYAEVVGRVGVIGDSIRVRRGLNQWYVAD